jgi:uncharacterized membrane protein
MSKEIQWLYKESRQWVEHGVITSDQAQRIQSLYPASKPGLPWSTILFAGLGSIVTGLGIILLLAYNWHVLGKGIKLAIIFSGIALLHSAGLYLFQRQPGKRQLGEALCLLGSMLFGAGIWLVAQIYHIDEHFPDGFFIWGLGALALAWAMPSIAQGLLAAAVLCIWNCSEGWGFDHTLLWAPVLILAGVGLLAWRLRSRVLLASALIAFNFSVSATISATQEGLVFIVLLNSASAFVAASLLALKSPRFPQSAGIWTFFGWAVFLFCLFLLTFRDTLRSLLGWRLNAERPVSLTFEWLPLLVSLALWTLVLWQLRPGSQHKEEPQYHKFELWLLPLTSMACQVFAVGRFFDTSSSEVASVFNLVFLAFAIAWMVRGCRDGRFRPTLLGSGLLVALVTARYFDLFENLAVRGAVFLAVGGLLILEGLLFQRSRRRILGVEVKA